MIESFRHRGLKELFETGNSTAVRPDLHRRVIIRLDALDAATSLDSLRSRGSISLRCAAGRNAIRST